MEQPMVPYNLICYIAKRRSRKCPPNIDWRDLAQEAALCVLKGRKSIEWAMLDYLRSQGMFGKTKIFGNYPKRVDGFNTGTILSYRPHSDSTLMARTLKAINSLPASYRRVLELKYYEGQTQREIAKALKVHETRVSHIHSAAIQSIQRKVTCQN